MELKYIAKRAGRLSSFLRGEMAMSAGLMNRLKWQDRLFVNGVAVHTDFPVQPGDEITVPLDEPRPEYPAEQEAVDILYEDEHLLAVDKSAGMLVHPSRGKNTGTLANRVLGYYDATKQNCAFHPITRLDRDTFGVVLLAKNAYVHALLTEMLTQGKLEKTYHAITFGGPEDAEGTIDAPIARLPLPSLLRKVDPEGKPSVTRYQVLQRKNGLCHLALNPITGRTHQLRVHCAYKGFPILGDPQYGSGESIALSQQRGICGQLLCAKELRLPHPVTGEPLRILSHQKVSQYL